MTSADNEMVLLGTKLTVSKVTLLLSAKTTEIMHVHIIMYLYLVM